jgi:hypothetical protein
VHGAPGKVGAFYLIVSDGPGCVPVDAFVQTATPDNTLAHVTYLTRPYSDSQPSALVFATHRVGKDSSNGPFNNSPLGVWYHGTGWSLFNENLSAIALGTSFNVAILPASESIYSEIAEESDTFFNSTRINAPSATGNSSAVIQVTQNFNPGGEGGTYNNKPIGVWYDGNFWYVFNQDGSNMPLGAGFNVAISEETDGAFVHTATANNTASATTWINHPATNGDPDAIVLVTQNWNPPGGGSVYNNAPVAVQYLSGFWFIFNENFSPMPIGASFNVSVLPLSPD